MFEPFTIRILQPDSIGNHFVVSRAVVASESATRFQTRAESADVSRVKDNQLRRVEVSSITGSGVLGGLLRCRGRWSFHNGVAVRHDLILGLRDSRGNYDQSPLGSLRNDPKVRLVGLRNDPKPRLVVVGERDGKSSATGRPRETQSVHNPTGHATRSKPSFAEQSVSLAYAILVPDC